MLNDNPTRKSIPFPRLNELHCGLGVAAVGIIISIYALVNSGGQSSDTSTSGETSKKTGSSEVQKRRDVTSRSSRTFRSGEVGTSFSVSKEKINCIGDGRLDTPQEECEPSDFNSRPFPVVRSNLEMRRWLRKIEQEEEAHSEQMKIPLTPDQVKEFDAIMEELED